MGPVVLEVQEITGDAGAPGPRNTHLATYTFQVQINTAPESYSEQVISQNVSSSSF